MADKNLKGEYAPGKGGKTRFLGKTRLTGGEGNGPARLKKATRTSVTNLGRKKTHSHFLRNVVEIETITDWEEHKKKRGFKKIYHRRKISL